MCKSVPQMALAVNATMASVVFLILGSLTSFSWRPCGDPFNNWCGNCSYCRAGYFAQCDKANPNGPDAGTAFFGGPKSSGPFDGLQAEKARFHSPTWVW